MRSLEKENTRVKKIVAELELFKLILKESLSYLKRRAWRPGSFVTMPPCGSP